MPRTQISCPNCRQPVAVNIKQLFDVGVNPADKQIFLSGAVNMIECPHCGFRGALGTPIVYHDPDKELLLTFVPSELGLPRDEQERAIGALLKQAMDKLAPEKRKAYLLNPQAFFTFQSLVERVLAADGITKEVIQAQQERMKLIERLINASSEENVDEIIQQEENLMDDEFFTLFSSLTQSAVDSGDERAARKFIVLQDKLLRVTKAGQEILAQAREIQEARIALEEAGEDITREKLLEIVLAAPNDLRLNALVSYARPLMDYAFFQQFTNRIAGVGETEEKRLIQLRSKLLEYTKEYDQEVDTRLKRARQNLETLLNAEDIESALLQNLPVVDQFFAQVMSQELEAARKAGNLEKSAKLNKMAEILQQISTPPEVALIEDLLEAGDDEAVRTKIQESKLEITKDFLELLEQLVKQAQTARNTDLITRTQRVYDVAKGMAK